MFWSEIKKNEQFERLIVKRKNGYKRAYNLPLGGKIQNEKTDHFIYGCSEAI